MIKIIKQLFKYLPTKRVRRFWIILLGMICVAVLETVTAGAISFYAASVANPQVIITDHLPRFEHIIPGIAGIDSKGLILYLSLSVILLVLLKNASMAATSYTAGLFTANVSGYLGEHMLKGFLEMPYEWHLQHNSADLIQGIGWSQYFGVLLTSSLKLLSDILIITILLTTILIASPAISLLVFLTIGGTSLLIIKHVRLSMDRLAATHRDFNTAINREVTMALHGIKEVKVYRCADAFTQGYSRNIYGFARIDARLGFINQLPGWVLEIVGVSLLSSAIMIMFLWFGDSTVKITGTIALLAVTSWRVMPAMSRILNSLNAIRQSFPYVQTGLAYLREIDSRTIAGPSPEGPSADFTHELRLENISFTYEGANRFAINEVSLTIPRGQTLGIIGTSGAGKSTLADIAIGLLHPSSGDIMLDGRTVTIENLKHWQSLIGYVPQTPYIAPATLAENIAFGVRTEGIDQEKVLQCCKLAAMDDFLHQLPDGINSFLGERGVKLSGGQRQRVAIARALYHDPEVIIFDEATSALDARNEQTIKQTIYSLKERMTLIIIAHRLTTVEGCDHIVWIEKGRIKLAGDADTVLENYRKYYQEPCLPQQESLS
ncbi:MAG: ABC transporter ATP-binding protein [Desulfomonilia bacterium]|nr:ABC transporter ATP-binding protein/permease [Deltaproteobacteria bacterium]